MSDRPLLPLTRVPGIGPVLAQRLADVRIHTIHDLLDAPEDRIHAAGLPPNRIPELLQTARVIVDGRPRLSGHVRPFPQAPTFVDVETSHDRQDDPWLIGVLGPQGELVQLEQLDPGRHDELLAELEALVERWSPAPVVSWGNYDKIALRRCYRRVGRPTPRWLDAAWFDAHEWVRSAVILPLSSLKLEVVAAYFGYASRGTGLDGLTVGRLYSAFRDREAPFDLAQVRAYNADDVQALAHVVDAVRALVAAEPDEFDIVERAVDLIALEEGRTADAIAAILGLPEQHLRSLLDELEDHGHLSSDGEGERRWFLR